MSHLCSWWLTVRASPIILMSCSSIARTLPVLKKAACVLFLRVKGTRKIFLPARLTDSLSVYPSLVVFLFKMRLSIFVSNVTGASDPSTCT